MATNKCLFLAPTFSNSMAVWDREHNDHKLVLPPFYPLTNLFNIPAFPLDQDPETFFSVG